MNKTEHPLRKILELTQDQWDHPAERKAVRENFRKVQACRTPALGGRVYASTAGEKTFYNTCKSKCCPSCGNRGTLLWQREQWATMPDVPFVGLVLTMPNVCWPIFRAHRHLQHDLPALGAAVLQQWAWTNFRTKVGVIVVQHTFGGRLNHNPHLHIMVSAGGLNPVNSRWVERVKFDRDQIMALWRFAVTSYLWRAHRSGLLQRATLPPDFDNVVLEQVRRRWNIYISSQMSKQHFLQYAGRYIRRLPIAQKRILSVTEDEVLYQSKDTRTKALLESRCTPEEFVAMLSQHVLDRYQHSMRYFGLLAPRTRGQTLATILFLLHQPQRRKPPRQRWADALKKQFGVDPLIDKFGNQMLWIGQRWPAPTPA